MNARQIPPAPSGSTREAQTARSSAKLRCTVSRYGSQQTDLRYAAPPLRVTLRLAALRWDVEFFDVAKAHSHTPSFEPQNGPLFLFPRRSRNPGLLWKAHRVIPGDRRAQQLWQEHFNKCLSKFGVVPCTPDPTSQCSPRERRPHQHTRRSRVRNWATARAEPRDY